MAEMTQKVAEKKSLRDLLDESNFRFVVDRIMKTRKNEGDDRVSYEPFTHKTGTMEIDINPVHVPTDTLFKEAKSSCKDCNSKGYQVHLIPKQRIRNPEDYIVLSEVPFRDLSEEEKKKIIEQEAKKTTWKVMLPCRCAVKRALMKDNSLLVNELGNIVVSKIPERNF